MKKDDDVKYNPNEIEKKWNEIWEKEKIYSPNLENAAKPYYNLMMFPYPSAEGLHVGNMYAFTGSDIWGRFKRMQGHDVFEPIGLDGFGIHSENYAIKAGKHPMELSKVSQKNFYRQLHMIGNSYDWTRTLETYDPNYYKWTQWLFVQMFKKGLAYRAKSKVNWCPSCKTVLADEQVIKKETNIGVVSVCERCETPVEKRELKQWFFRITEYADRLLNNLEKLDWSEKVKIAQKNWIGKSEGALIKFQISSPIQSDSNFKSQVRFNRIQISNENLKFDSKLTPLILSGEKYITYRLRPKNIKEGDVVEFMNSETNENFALARITRLEEKLMKDISEKQSGHETYTTREEMYETYENYYKTKVNDKTKVWLYYFEIINHEIEVFTTRPDTLYGATFLVLSPEHLLVKEILRYAQDDKNKEIESYVENAKKKTEEERVAEGKEKTGVFTGLHAINPATNEQIPIYIADYVLMDYGAGAIMGVPGHDNRDYEFAQKFNLPIKIVIEPDRNSKFKIQNSKAQVKNQKLKETYVGNGVIVNSGEWNGWKYPEDIGKVINWLEEKGIGKNEVTYHLRDWLISRQRYWGPPIPMVYCPTCAKAGRSWFNSEEANSHNREISNIKYQISNKNRKEKIGNWKLPVLSLSNGEIGNSADWSADGWFPVEEKDLPVKLPYIENYQPKGSGESPLAQDKEWVKTKCPNCGGDADRETDVSDTFLDSSWYYLRYLCTDCEEIPFPSEVFVKPVIASGTKQSQVGDRHADARNDINKRVRWLPVDMYIGGAEHAVLHLMYVRFVAMVLHDLGYVNFSAKVGLPEEPFPRFFAHGLLIKEGAKMSKSKGNIIVPDEYINKYGADTLRCYLMFLGPLSAGGDFYDTGIEGMARFIKRVWVLFTQANIVSLRAIRQPAESAAITKGSGIASSQAPRNDSNRLRFMHKTIKKVTEGIERFSYNTSIAALMEWYNFLSEELRTSTFAKASADKQNSELKTEEAETFLKLLAPFAPFMTEELWHRPESGIRNHKSGEKEKNHNSLFLSAGRHGMIHDSIHVQLWPKYDPKYLEEDEVVVVIQVNGKRRGEIKIKSENIKNQIDIEKIAKEEIEKYLEGKKIKKVIYVEGKIINFVI